MSVPLRLLFLAFPSDRTGNASFLTLKPIPMTDANLTTASLSAHLPFVPNAEQRVALDKISSFLDPDCPDQFFLLKGSAGTGKTSLLRAVTDYLTRENRIFYLTAPTGRAAQIIGKKTGHPAGTTHSLVYLAEPDEDGLVVTLLPKTNRETGPAVFIVDEASLVNDHIDSRDESFVCRESLLTRLLNYAREGNSCNKLLFIGDEYQLPPVGANFSPALSEEYLVSKFRLRGSSYSLQQVMRQSDDSYILDNAEMLRESIRAGRSTGPIRFTDNQTYGSAIREYGRHFTWLDDSSSVMLARSNKQGQAMNRAVRRELHGWGETRQLLPGDLLIANQNTVLGGEVLYRGSSVWVEQTGKTKLFGGLHFLDCHVIFQSLEGNRVETGVKILIETLVDEKGQLTLAQRKALVHEAMKKNRKFRESRSPEDDAFVGALQARYGYALTCHRAQGGEWKRVFLNPMYGTADGKWLYTAVTRASEHLYSWSS